MKVLTVVHIYLLAMAILVIGWSVNMYEALARLTVDWRDAVRNSRICAGWPYRRGSARCSRISLNTGVCPTSYAYSGTDAFRRFGN